MVWVLLYTDPVSSVRTPLVSWVWIIKECYNSIAPGVDISEMYPSGLDLSSSWS